MVSTGNANEAAATALTTTAIRMPGHDGRSVRSPTMIASETMVTATAAAFTVGNAIGAPSAATAPLLRSIALAVEPRRLGQRALLFLFEQMHLRVWKIIEAAGVIEIEVGQHDVTHVRRGPAEPLDLPDGRHLLAKVGAQECQEQATQACLRIAHVLQPEPGVDQDQPLLGFDQQAMAAQASAAEDAAGASVHQASSERTRRDAI